VIGAPASKTAGVLVEILKRVRSASGDAHLEQRVTVGF
jgi:hypothetical protein